jgi:hypothetical protein
VPRSVPPPPPPHTRARPRDASDLLAAEDIAFINALREGGLVPDLTGEELRRSAALVRPGLDLMPESRRIDLLEAHYAAGGDQRVSRARRSVDRFLLSRESDAVSASQLLSRIIDLTPELGAVSLERVGGGKDGPLVLRAGDHLAALLDDYEESLETGEIDLRDLEEAKARGTMVTLRGLIHATNTLLERFNVRERFVALRSDEAREVYVATPLTEAIDLARAGHLEDDVESVVELGCW